jgi:hypothetical protein
VLSFLFLCYYERTLTIASTIAATASVVTYVSMLHCTQGCAVSTTALCAAASAGHAAIMTLLLHTAALTGAPLHSSCAAALCAAAAAGHSAVVQQLLSHSGYSASVADCSAALSAALSRGHSRAAAALALYRAQHHSTAAVGAAVQR